MAIIPGTMLTYGPEDPGPEEPVTEKDIGQLHLDALRASGRMELNPDLVEEPHEPTPEELKDQRRREALSAETRARG